MKDVVKEEPEISIAIDEVGIRNLKYPISIEMKPPRVFSYHLEKGNYQNTIGEFEMSAKLDSYKRGIHMSRFVEMVHHNHEHLNLNKLLDMAKEMSGILDSTSVNISVTFDYPLMRMTPKTKMIVFNTYPCSFVAEYSYYIPINKFGTMAIIKEKLETQLVISIPVMSVCPCSVEICETGIGHNQRCIITISVEMDKEFIWIEDIIDLVENEVQPVRALVKREDEKAMVENAFSKPMFVEDIVRLLYDKLKSLTNNNFVVEINSIESIHNHIAFAKIRREE